MKYANMDWGTMEAVINKLGGMEGVERFLSGRLIVKSPERTWKTWRTIKLGTGLKTGNDFVKVLKRVGCEIDYIANDILNKPTFTVSETERCVELICVSVKELGFNKGANHADICKRAQEFGLSLCPAEVGPQLCLQQDDQTENNNVMVAMNPIIDSVGKPNIFNVQYYNSGKRHLDGNFGNSCEIWYPCHPFVFLLQNNSKP